ncbi:MAG: potassium transporter TrkH [Rickettsiales bacterium]|nr:potassium transporter TrkH [Rickettsiales bacterium]OUV54170.1 MAG: hypothetical protein CBC87_02530 [Rickettsiales bacterium TMED127]|tara:strand:+ start:13537 stop:14985 length:1449 start_codon:yes stop_codon:yes gene_type:complete
MSNFRSSLFIIGNLLIFFALYMIIPIVIDLYNGGTDWIVFVSISSFCFFVGFNISFVFKKKKREVNVASAFFLTLLCWIVLTLIGSLPFYLGSTDLVFVDAFFESMSGITTTGATVIQDLDNTSKAILIWRAMLQWLGGIGVIVLAIAVFPILKVGGMQLFKTEFSSKEDKVFPRTVKIASGIGFVYLFLTLLCFLSLVISGMSLFDGIAHAMTIIATGGFSTKNMSIGHFNSVYIEFFTIIFMVISSLPFLLLFQLFKGKYIDFLKNSQIRFFFSIILILTLIITFWLQKYYEVNFLQALRIAAFSIVSITTGSGFSTYDFSVWGSFSTLILLFFMLIGGCSGSSSCGLKIFRMQILIKNTHALIRKIIQPRGIFIPTYNSKPISDDILASVTGFFYLYIMIFGSLTLILAYDGLDIITSLSGAAAAIANVGPGLSEQIGPSANYEGISDFSKIFLSLAMLIGRLELYPVIILFSPAFWRN